MSENIAAAIAAKNEVIAQQGTSLDEVAEVLGTKAAGGTDISLGLTSAAVGQIIKVKAVDESGKPTAWEAADMPSGGGSAVELDTTLTQSGKAADAKAVGDALADKQPKGDYLTQDNLQSATNVALEQAKASGEFDGADGRSAYAYAVESGYTGTETEFAAKLASEALIVTITDNNGTLSADKSYDEIMQAIRDGTSVIVYYNSTGLHLIAVMVGILYFGAIQCVNNETVAMVGTNIIEITQYGEVNDISAVVKTLPNPNALTFTGAVNATYDGSEAVSVEIPSGGGTDISLGLTSASVGQIIKVKAIDESGKPTAWEAAEMAGGAEHWEKIADIDLRSDTSKYVLADFGVWRKAKVIMTRPKFISGLQKNVWVKVVKKGGISGYNCGHLESSYGYVYWEFAAEVDDIFISSTSFDNNNPNVATAIKSTLTLTPLDGAPSEYEFILLFTDTSVIQEGDRVTVIGVKR